MHMKNRMTALFLQVLLDYLKSAYAAGMIQDEELWLDALKDRNNVAHAYNESIAYDIAADAKERFYDMFCALRKEIEQRWIE